MNKDNRLPLLKALEKYERKFQDEKETLNRFRSFIQTNQLCFSRSNLDGHVTASAWILSPSSESVLLLKHKKLGIWVQPGGHCDGESDTLGVALREAFEETGLEYPEVLSSEIFDIDIHEIPALNNIPRHFHFDVRYLLKSTDLTCVKNDESTEICWVKLDEVIKYTSENSLLRMVQKTSDIYQSPKSDEN